MIEITFQEGDSKSFETLLKQHMEAPIKHYEKERVFAADQMKDSGKPAQVVEKIIEGKLGKFFQDACLLNQAFIKNDKQTVAQYLDEAGKKLGLVITAEQFKRFAIGR